MEKLHETLTPLVEKLRIGTIPEQEEIDNLGKIYQEMYELIENI